jgi:hypothetical protein
MRTMIVYFARVPNFDEYYLQFKTFLRKQYTLNKYTNMGYASKISSATSICFSKALIGRTIS